MLHGTKSARIARDLREQYTLGFTPEKKKGDSYRKSRVEVAAPGRGKLQVRTRAGYFTAQRKRSVDRVSEDRP
jgi:hypothetical protein